MLGYQFCPPPFLKITSANSFSSLTPSSLPLKIQGNKSRGSKTQNSQAFSANAQILGSYYEATVVANMGTNYVIQYNNLVDEFNDFVSLKETVKAVEVQPHPPKIMEANAVFHVGDRIDAYDLDGWWVDTNLSEENGSRHQFVFFKTIGQELDYPVLKLRVHQDWHNGKWVSSKKTKRNVVR